MLFTWMEKRRLKSKLSRHFLCEISFSVPHAFFRAHEPLKLREVPGDICKECSSGHYIEASSNTVLEHYFLFTDALDLNAEEKVVLIASTKSPISFLSKLGQTISRKRSPKVNRRVFFFP